MEEEKGKKEVRVGKERSRRKRSARKRDGAAGRRGDVRVKYSAEGME